MDNISKQQELQHADQDFIEHLKQTQCKTKSIIEYKNLNIAIFDTTLFICFPSIKENYPIALRLLSAFKHSISPLITPSCREALVRYFWEHPDDPSDILQKIAQRNVFEDKTAGKKSLDENMAKGCELCSKILLCFNGELNSAINARID
jgi:hypothetical protein